MNRDIADFPLLTDREIDKLLEQCAYGLYLREEEHDTEVAMARAIEYAVRATFLAEIERLREELACVREALPEEWRNSKLSVAVTTLAAENDAMQARVAELERVQSRWWDSAHEALEQWRQAVRAMEASIDAVQPEASTTLKEAESHARICAKLAEEHKDDVLVCVALTDAAAIIRDLLRDRLSASATGAGQADSARALRLADDAAESAIYGEAMRGNAGVWTLTQAQIAADPYLEDALAHLQWRGLADVERASDGVTVILKTR
ncbi:MAG: hypothetical protein ACK4ZD_03275 [Caldimonas sp.]|uniref:hypothetical protein n=1 Tax=Caldimonas sp. TaxID=2838790 RepID=UPI00391B3819